MALVKYNDQSISAITEIATSAKDAMVLIKTITASSSDLITFDSDIDSTYPIYKFVFVDVHPQTDDQDLTVNFRDGSTAYDATKTTGFFYAEGEESGGGQISYDTDIDVAQGTGVQTIINNIGNDNDQNGAGYLYLFNPSSTTFVKHFISRCQSARANDRTWDNYAAGYCNVTAAIDGVQFKFSSGNIDAGTFKMYGIKDS